MNKTTPAFTANSGNTGILPWQGGEGSVWVYGTWGGGTIKIQWSPDNINWFDATSDTGGSVPTFTANFALTLSFAPGYLRGVLSGATSPSLILGCGEGISHALTV